PLLLVSAARQVGAHQGPVAGELLALQAELELAAPVALVRIAVGLPDAAIPDDHIARAVLPGRNGALEAGVVQRMGFHVHGQALVLGVQAWALGHRPALQGAVQFQAEVVVQTAGVVLLDDETQGATLAAALAYRRFIRLGGDAEVALATVLVKLPDHALLRLAP